jgi:hypothetical protein
MRILCIHGIGRQEAGPRDGNGRLVWQIEWERFIASGLHRWDPQIQTEFQFLAYDKYFAETPLNVGNSLGGLGSLLLSGGVNSIGDVFRPRRAFGDLGEKVKWYAEW